MNTADMYNLPNLNVYKSRNGHYRCSILSMRVTGFGYQATNFQFQQELKASTKQEARKQFIRLLREN
ncbi:MAG: hypothetical protein TR69_WS6001000339 [candidate division WS6 bacterium OLB20]|uniref:Uncharacterized protein n=1 Tax=candidate division WS6 bacterium OLB20 TaxID=1617426 RepID=A0A136M0N5_9BACT|nr:MAG: hypothetical protein TR69_WS6001000339 [candidate division WS6 bacterium OLB20]